MITLLTVFTVTAQALLGIPVAIFLMTLNPMFMVPVAMLLLTALVAGLIVINQDDDKPSILDDPRTYRNAPRN